MLEIVSTSVFYEMASLLVLAAGVGLIGMFLRQPLIVSFIAVGILAGPAVLGLAQSDEHIKLLAELGIAVLLFLVGLKLDIKLVRTLGTVALLVGIGQMAFTFSFGFAIGYMLGLDTTTNLFISVALMFSSTIIIVKLLSDKREIDSLHGQIALGVLIIQDIAVVFAMIALSAVGSESDSAAISANILRIFGSAVVLLIGVGLFIRYIAEPLVERLARTPELLVCFSIGWAALFAAIGDFVGFSMELGGLVSGVSLASTRLREAMAARLAPLRDFLLLFFFIALGAHLDLSQVGQQIPAAIALSLFVLIGKPLIVLILIGRLGYRKRTGVYSGFTLAQISEFSLIFMAMGVSLGHLGSDALALLTLVALITISLSTYMITYTRPLYDLFEPVLGMFERKQTHREFDRPELENARPYDVFLFGLGRYGGAIAQRLRANDLHVLGIDFNPVAVKRWRQEGFDTIYGDATDPEFIAHLPLENVSWAVSATPEHDTGVTRDDVRIALIHALQDQGFTGKIAVTSHQEDDTDRLRAGGADLVLLPFQDAADQAVDLIKGQHLPERFDVIEADDQMDIPS